MVRAREFIKEKIILEWILRPCLGELLEGQKALSGPPKVLLDEKLCVVNFSKSCFSFCGKLKTAFGRKLQFGAFGRKLFQLFRKAIFLTKMPILK